MNAGDKIKQLRLSRGLTLEEVGQLVGVGKSTVRKWETGAIANMRRDKIAKLADALGITPTDIINMYDPTVSDIPSPAPQIVLSSGEEELVGCYRSMNPEGQTAALAAVRGLASSGLYKKRDDPPDLLDLGDGS